MKGILVVLTQCFLPWHCFICMGIVIVFLYNYTILYSNITIVIKLSVLLGHAERMLLVV